MTDPDNKCWMFTSNTEKKETGKRGRTWMAGGYDKCKLMKR